ncbi:MAG TPA: nucleotide exchange factor GrpE [Candidatus Omnitrophota bacterium]|nr:nucleotide exchange factor GrpE [Candidatus Omnitrophota bacterium]HPS37289.1 nucleotide exchange factor GrpE [Candidatus Omnitrophota bacterium]
MSKKNHHHEKPEGDKPISAPSEAPAGDKIEVSKQEYEALTQKVAELEGLREKFLHAAADFENAKKRNARDKEEFIKFSQERILREILPVLDNFERAINHATVASATVTGEDALQQNLKTLISGVQMVQKQLFDILKVHGLKRIGTAGQKFDPHFHEVVGHVTEEGAEDQIVDELEPGYMLHDRLLRAAKVRVRVPPQATGDQKLDEIT